MDPVRLVARFRQDGVFADDWVEEHDGKRVAQYARLTTEPPPVVFYFTAWSTVDVLDGRHRALAAALAARASVPVAVPLRDAPLLLPLRPTPPA